MLRIALNTHCAVCCHRPNGVRQGSELVHIIEILLCFTIATAGTYGNSSAPASMRALSKSKNKHILSHAAAPLQDNTVLTHNCCNAIMHHVCSVNGIREPLNIMQQHIIEWHVSKADLRTPDQHNLAIVECYYAHTPCAETSSKLQLTGSCSCGQQIASQLFGLQM